MNTNLSRRNAWLTTFEPFSGLLRVNIEQSVRPRAKGCLQGQQMKFRGSLGYSEVVYTSVRSCLASVGGILRHYFSDLAGEIGVFACLPDTDPFLTRSSSLSSYASAEETRRAIEGAILELIEVIIGQHFSVAVSTT